MNTQNTQLLESFANMNDNLLILDNKIRTMNSTLSVCIEAHIDNLSDVLGEFNIANHLGLESNEQHKFYISGNNMIIPEIVDSFILTDKVLNMINSHLLNENDCVYICGDGEWITLSVWIPQSSTYVFKTKISKSDKIYSLIIPERDFKLFSGEYVVNITRKSIIIFNHKEIDYTYYVAPYKGSVYPS